MWLPLGVYGHRCGADDFMPQRCSAVHDREAALQQQDSETAGSKFLGDLGFNQGLGRRPCLDDVGARDNRAVPQEAKAAGSKHSGSGSGRWGGGHA